MLIAGCGASRAQDEEPSPSPSTATRTATIDQLPPTATPTPDPLARPPGTAQEALSALEEYLPRASDLCPTALVERWDAECHTGDFDGDGEPDAAYLVPLRSPAATPLHGATVIVRRRAHDSLEAFPVYALAESSFFGRYAFSIADRTGDGRDDLTYLANLCSARGCASRIEVQTWDGTTWRDVGTDQPGVDSLQRLEITGEGAETEIVMHAGVFEGPGAGPTRAGVYHYAWANGRYSLAKTELAPPEYLIHAIQDADDRLETESDLRGARDAYRAVITNTELKDWKAESGTIPAGGVSGRGQLTGYALFRIAVITAALGEDPTLALDTTIVESEEPLFANAAEAFRRGYREAGTVRAGCLEVSRYLATPPVPAYITQLFDYGYANPAPTSADICPF